MTPNPIQAMLASSHRPQTSARAITKSSSQCAGPREQPSVQSSPTGRKSAERNEMHRSIINLIAVAERSEHGYADVPPGSINDQIESELAAFGYAVALSDRLWVGGYRVHTPESIQFG